MGVVIYCLFCSINCYCRLYSLVGNGVSGGEYSWIKYSCIIN